MAEKSKILVIGGTGHIGKFIVEASVKAGHATYVLVRESYLSNGDKANIIHNFKNSGVFIILGDIQDHEVMVEAIKQVDVVISTVGRSQIAEQEKIVAAIREAGGVKRFLPSEFGTDVDRAHTVEPVKSAYATKAKFRRMVEAANITYTYVASNCFSYYHLSSLCQLGATTPPRDKVVILGDGSVKAIFNVEEDVAAYTIKAVDDPRTLNKILFIRCPQNTYSFNDVVSLWEKKIGKMLKRVYLSEEQLLKKIQESSSPVNMILSIFHSVLVKGDQTNFKIEPSFGAEASELYPDVKYTTIDAFLSRFV